MVTACQSVQQTAFGVIRIDVENNAITRVVLPCSTLQPDTTSPATPLLVEAFAQLNAYFAGQLTAFDLPLNPQGTEFMRLVWDVLTTIPYGTTTSYQQVATCVGNPRACRAVGLANNKNPIPLFIPCHRVIGANGKLVGYAGGLSFKTALLELEARHALNLR